MEQTLTVKTKKPAKKRVWEIDFLRGFCMLFVIWDHLMFDFGILFFADFATPFGTAIGNFARSYWHSGIRAATHDYFVGAFVLVSGISTIFSKNDFKKALKVFAAAMVITLVSNAAAQYLGRGVTINFGVLHMLAACGFVWCFLKLVKTPDWLIFIFAVTALILGFYFQGQNLTEPAGLIFLFENRRARGWSPGDFFPLMPWLGWFLLGVVIGHVFYKDKTTKLAFVNEKYFSPFTYVGKHSLWFYLLSQGIGIILIAILVSFGWI